MWYGMSGEKAENTNIDDTKILFFKVAFGITALYTMSETLLRDSPIKLALDLLVFSSAAALIGTESYYLYSCVRDVYRMSFQEDKKLPGSPTTQSLETLNPLPEFKMSTNTSAKPPADDKKYKNPKLKQQANDFLQNLKILHKDIEQYKKRGENFKKNSSIVKNLQELLTLVGQLEKKFQEDKLTCTNFAPFTESLANIRRLSKTSFEEVENEERFQKGESLAATKEHCKKQINHYLAKLGTTHADNPSHFKSGGMIQKVREVLKKHAELRRELKSKLPEMLQYAEEIRTLLDRCEGQQVKAGELEEIKNQFVELRQRCELIKLIFDKRSESLTETASTSQPLPQIIMRIGRL